MRCTLKAPLTITSYSRLSKSSRARLPLHASVMQPLESSIDSIEALLVEEAVAWACQHGLIYGAGLDSPASAVVHAPLALLPTPYPRGPFEQAVQAAPIFNILMDAIAAEDEYLQSVLAAAAVQDDFTAALLHVHKATAPERAALKMAGKNRDLAVTRSDYMLHSPTNSLLQVEINTIASSFGCLSTLVGRLHKYLLDWSGNDTSSLPDNTALNTIVDAMGAAIASYKSPSSIMVMVVQPGEKNAYDQRWLSLTLWERHRVKTVRLTLKELVGKGTIDSQGALRIDEQKVALVYFRAGYSPDDYPTQEEWDGRMLVEKSDAFKCPSVAWQLAGAKKVQQDLATPGAIERFIDSPTDCELLRSFFAGLWGLEDVSSPGMSAVITDALAHPEGYVLKPQREGGGNNIYGTALVRKLSSAENLSAYILMQRILPPIRNTIMVRNGVAMEAEAVSELGIYGVMVKDGDRIVTNTSAGHLVRTKASSSDEGGVAAGFAVLDSPVLI